jgi:hypothetical protein
MTELTTSHTSFALYFKLLQRESVLALLHLVKTEPKTGAIRYEETLAILFQQLSLSVDGWTGELNELRFFFENLTYVDKQLGERWFFAHGQQLRKLLVVAMVLERLWYLREHDGKEPSPHDMPYYLGWVNVVLVQLEKSPGVEDYRRVHLARCKDSPFCRIFSEGKFVPAVALLGDAAATDSKKEVAVGEHWMAVRVAISATCLTAILFLLLGIILGRHFL